MHSCVTGHHDTARETLCVGTSIACSHTTVNSYDIARTGACVRSCSGARSRAWFKVWSCEADATEAAAYCVGCNTAGVVVSAAPNNDGGHCEIA